MNSKILIVIAILTLIVAFVGVLLMNSSHRSGELYVGGIMLALSDDDKSSIEKILRENMLVSFHIEKVDWISPRYYSIISTSDFNSIKETLWDNENIEITESKQQKGDTYIFFGGCFGKYEYNITELQSHLDEYSLEAKEVNWVYIKFGSIVRKNEILYTLDILENESNVIRAYPDVLDR